MGRHGRGRALAVVLATGLALAACTASPEPAPSPTPTPSEEAAPVPGGPADRIAVVVGPSSHVSQTEAIALERAVRELAEEPPEGVAEVRVVAADDATFTGDLVEFFVDDGFDLVCVVGSGAAPLLLDAARRHRATRLCGTDPAVEGGPANVVAAAVDPVALTTLAAAATVTADAPVGLVVGPEVAPIDVVEPLLTSLLPEPPPPPSPSPSPSPSDGASPTEAPVDDAGASPGPTPSPSPSPSPTTSPTPAPVPVQAVVGVSTVDGRGQALGTILDAEPEVAVLLVGRSTDLAAGLRTGGVDAVVVDDWVRRPGLELPDGVLVALEVDRALQLRAAVAAARDPDSSQVTLLGLADDVLGVIPGTLPGSGAAVARVEAAIEEATAG